LVEKIRVLNKKSVSRHVRKRGNPAHRSMERCRALSNFLFIQVVFKIDEIFEKSELKFVFTVKLKIASVQQEEITLSSRCV